MFKELPTAPQTSRDKDAVFFDLYLFMLDSIPFLIHSPWPTVTSQLSRRTISNSRSCSIPSITKQVFFQGQTPWETLSALLSFPFEAPWAFSLKHVLINVNPALNYYTWEHEKGLNQLCWLTPLCNKRHQELECLNILCFNLLNISLIPLLHLCATVCILVVKYDLILNSSWWLPPPMSETLPFTSWGPLVQQTIIRLPRGMTKEKRRHCTRLNPS